MVSDTSTRVTRGFVSCQPFSISDASFHEPLQPEGCELPLFLKGGLKVHSPPRASPRSAVFANESSAGWRGEGQKEIPGDKQEKKWFNTPEVCKVNRGFRFLLHLFGVLDGPSYLVR